MTHERLLTQKEAAAALQKSRWFVKGLQRLGLKLPATLTEINDFYRHHPNPLTKRKKTT